MVVEILGLLLIGFGVFFSLVGVIGIIRLPDVYSRIHASGKVSTLGIFGLLAGTAILMPETTLKLLGLGLFLLISAPVASHAIAAAAYRSGVPLALASRDDLAKNAIKSTET
jgi:multicomponent Na+:H+ antiporter subunit G